MLPNMLPVIVLVQFLRRQGRIIHINFSGLYPQLLLSLSVPNYVVPIVTQRKNQLTVPGNHPIRDRSTHWLSGCFHKRYTPHPSALVSASVCRFVLHPAAKQNQQQQQNQINSITCFCFCHATPSCYSFSIIRL